MPSFLINVSCAGGRPGTFLIRQIFHVSMWIFGYGMYGINGVQITL